MKLKGRWKRLSGAVYQSSNGDRVHLLGTMMIDGHITTINSCYLAQMHQLCRKIMGLNEKRAIMLMAEKLHQGEDYDRHSNKRR